MRLNLVRDINAVPNQAVTQRAPSQRLGSQGQRCWCCHMSSLLKAATVSMHACTRAVALYMYMSPGSARLGGRSGGGMSRRVALVEDGAARGE